MPNSKFNFVFCSLIVIVLLDACVRGLNKLEELMRAKRYGFTNFDYYFNGLLDIPIVKMFNSVQYKRNCLHCVLPSVEAGDCNLRIRGHNFY
jgi:hypothetical protein